MKAPLVATTGVTVVAPAPPASATDSAVLQGPGHATGAITLGSPLVTTESSSPSIRLDVHTTQAATVTFYDATGPFATLLVGTPRSRTTANEAALICTILLESPSPRFDCTSSGSVSTVSFADAPYPVGLYAVSSDPGVVQVEGTGSGGMWFSHGVDAVAVNGQIFTAAASSPDSTEYDNASTLATAINGATGTNATATASGNTVTVTAKAFGPSGDSIALGTDDTADTTLSGATLTGGSTYGTLTLAFSQPIDTATLPASGFTADLTLSGGHTFGTGATASWNGTDTVLTIDLGSAATVAPGDTVAVAPGVRDAAGSPVPGPIPVSGHALPK